MLVHISKICYLTDLLMAITKIRHFGYYLFPYIHKFKRFKDTIDQRNVSNNGEWIGKSTGAALKLYKNLGLYEKSNLSNLEVT